MQIPFLLLTSILTLSQPWFSSALFSLPPEKHFLSNLFNYYPDPIQDLFVIPDTMFFGVCSETEAYMYEAEQGKLVRVGYSYRRNNMVEKTILRCVPVRGSTLIIEILKKPNLALRLRDYRFSGVNEDEIDIGDANTSFLDLILQHQNLIVSVLVQGKVSLKVYSINQFTRKIDIINKVYPQPWTQFKVVSLSGTTSILAFQDKSFALLEMDSLKLVNYDSTSINGYISKAVAISGTGYVIIASVTNIVFCDLSLKAFELNSWTTDTTDITFLLNLEGTKYYIHSGPTTSGKEYKIYVWSYEDSGTKPVDFFIIDKVIKRIEYISYSNELLIETTDDFRVVNYLNSDQFRILHKKAENKFLQIFEPLQGTNKFIYKQMNVNTLILFDTDKSSQLNKWDLDTEVVAVKVLRANNYVLAADTKNNIHVIDLVSNSATLKTTLGATFLSFKEYDPENVILLVDAVPSLLKFNIKSLTFTPLNGMGKILAFAVFYKNTPPIIYAGSNEKALYRYVSDADVTNSLETMELSHIEYLDYTDNILIGCSAAEGCIVQNVFSGVKVQLSVTSFMEYSVHSHKNLFTTRVDDSFYIYDASTNTLALTIFHNKQSKLRIFTSVSGETMIYRFGPGLDLYKFSADCPEDSRGYTSTDYVKFVSVCLKYCPFYWTSPFDPTCAFSCLTSDTQVDSTTFPGVSACTSEIPNKCQISNLKGECLKCLQNNYIINKSFKICSDCANPGSPAFQSRIDGYGYCNNQCLVSVNNCDICIENKYCSKCLAPYFLYSSTRTNQYDQCSFCSSRTLAPKDTINSLGDSICLDCSLKWAFCTSCRDGICENCDETYFLLDKNGIIICDKCLAEDQYQYHNSDGIKNCGLCKNYINFCESCSNVYGQKTVCLQCATGYYLLKNPDTNEISCNTCNDGENYFKQEINGKRVCSPCSDSISKCSLCSADGKSCKQCEIGLWLHSSKNNENFDQCINCTPPELVPSINSGTLTRSTGKEVCLDCKAKIENCEQCQDQICLKCTQNYYLFDVKEDGEYTQCSLCNEASRYKGNHPETNYLICYPCSNSLAGCDECANDPTQCRRCKFQTIDTNLRFALFYDNDLKKYTSCGECQGVEYVRVMYSEFADECKPCSDANPHCLYCQSKSICTKCEQSYFLSRYSADGYLSCELCDQDFNTPFEDGITTSDGSAVCTSCNQKYSNCEKCQKGKCFSCITDFYLLVNNNNIALCDTCIEGKGLFRSVDRSGRRLCHSCAQLIPNCEKCSPEKLNCELCANEKDGKRGFLFDLDGDGLYENCKPECLDPAYFIEPGKINDQQKLCKKCGNSIFGCIECYGNSTFCKKCEPGKLLTEDGKCEVCPASTFLAKDKCMTCSETFANCIECTPNSCTKCSSGFYLNETKVCSQCSAFGNCSECNGETCSRCENGFYKTFSGELLVKCSKCNQEGEGPAKDAATDGTGICLGNSSDSKNIRTPPLKAKIFQSPEDVLSLIVLFDQNIVMPAEKDVKNALSIKLGINIEGSTEWEIKFYPKDTLRLIIISNSSIPETQAILDILNPLAFVSETGVTLSEVNSQNIESKTNTSKLIFKLPMYLKEEENLEGQGNSFKQAASAVIVISLLLSSSNYLFSSDLSLLWSFLNAMQLASFMLMINLRYPKNCKDFLVVLLNSHLKFIPDSLMDYLNIKSSKTFGGLKVVDEQQRAPERFNDLGISSNILENSGLHIQILVYFHVFHLLFNLLLSKSNLKNGCFKSLFEKLAKHLNYSLLIFINNLCFLNISLYTFLQMTNFSTETNQLIFQGFLSLWCLAYIIFFTTWIGSVLRKEESLIAKEDDFKQKYKPLVEDISTKNIWTKNFHLFLLLQRLFFSFGIVAFHGAPVALFVILILIQIFFLFLHYKYHPIVSTAGTYFKVCEHFFYLLLYSLAWAINNMSVNLKKSFPIINRDHELAYINAGVAFNIIIILLLFLLMFYNIYLLFALFKDHLKDIKAFFIRKFGRNSTGTSDQGLALNKLSDSSFSKSF